MKRWVVGLSAIGALAATAVLAQDRAMAPFAGRGMGGGWARMMSPDDRAAFTDARIAALHAGLKLTADQEKLWPPVEDAIRGWVKERQDARTAQRDRMEAAEAGGARDIPGMLRFMADRQSRSADALRKLADATSPLYTALDDAQKRRLVVLGRGLQPGMGRRGHMGEGGMGGGGMGGGGRNGPGRDGPMRRG